MLHESCRFGGDPWIEEREGVSAPLAAYIEARTTEFGRVAPDRRATLLALGAYVRAKVAQQRPASLWFLGEDDRCRAPLAQIWAQTAAWWCEGGVVMTGSAGLRAGRFDPAFATVLRRVGFDVQTGAADERIVKVRSRVGERPIVCYPKSIENAPRPGRGFALVCVAEAIEVPPALRRDAEEIVPVVYAPLADEAVAAQEDRERALDALCAQIAREMLYVFAQIPVRPYGVSRA